MAQSTNKHNEAQKAWASRNPDKTAAYAREWRARNPGKAAAAVAEWRKRNPGVHEQRMADRSRKAPIKVQLALIRGRAKTKNYDFDLTLEFLVELFAPMRCSVTGMELSFDGTDGHCTHPWTPSVDRRDSKRGYTQDNVRLVSWAYNNAKGDWPDEVVLEMARALVHMEGSAGPM